MDSRIPIAKLKYTKIPDFINHRYQNSGYAWQIPHFENHWSLTSKYEVQMDAHLCNVNYGCAVPFPEAPKWSNYVEVRILEWSCIGWLQVVCIKNIFQFHIFYSFCKFYENKFLSSCFLSITISFQVEPFLRICKKGWGQVTCAEEDTKNTTYLGAVNKFNCGESALLVKSEKRLEDSETFSAVRSDCDCDRLRYNFKCMSTMQGESETLKY